MSEHDDKPDRSHPNWNNWLIPEGSWPYWMLERLNGETLRMTYDEPPKGIIRELFSQVSRRRMMKSTQRAEAIAELEARPLSEYSDPVNRPSHYQMFPGQEAIDVIEAALTPEEFAGYLKGNALKYRLRAGDKGDTQQDIDKSNWYRRRLRGG